MTLGRSVPSSFDAFHVFRSKVKYNPTKVVKHVNMSEEFYDSYSYTDLETISKPLNHLNNGELLHNCYYDVEGLDIKLVFFNAFKCIKIYGNNKILSSPHVYEYSSSFFRNATGINLVQGARDLQYFRFVKQTFDCYTTF